jgi:hypothetical protein
MATVAYKSIQSNAFLAVLSPHTAAMPDVSGEKRIVRYPLRVTASMDARVQRLRKETKRSRNGLIRLLLELALDRVESDPRERAKL